jgi:ribosome-associated translation inhibitor RaiA
MLEPLRITFRNMDPSPALETKIRESAARLEELGACITSCHVTVESSHRRQQKGRIFHVRIDVIVPGAEIAISRDPELDHAHEDARVAIRDAFDAAKRRLQDLAGRRERYAGNPPRELETGD